MKQTTFWRCFLTEDRVLMGKNIIGKSDSSSITDSCLGRSRPHNAHPTTKINKVKDLALIFFDQCRYAPSRLHLLSKAC